MNKKITPKPSPTPPTERLQKMLARAGIGSRRQVETWIREGRIQVNRKLATIGEHINSQDEVYLDGRKLSLVTAPLRRILCYHKPVGEVCTRHDPEGRPTVFDHLPSPKQGRWISVGRLDFNTAGLLLFTTDGELAHRLMHPSYSLEREYAVRVLGKVDSATLERLQRGISLEEGVVGFKQIVDAGGQGANHWYHVILEEGRYHEVRRLWESQGVTVSRLIRIRFGPVLLPRHLRAGHHIPLDTATEEKLLQQVKLYQ